MKKLTCLFWGIMLAVAMVFTAMPAMAESLPSLPAAQEQAAEQQEQAAEQQEQAAEQQEVYECQLDIKPGSDPNSINLKSKGVVPVAILTTEDFDASTVDPETVEFAGASPVRWAIEDVDGDGDMDMILHFKTQDISIQAGDTEASLTAQAEDGWSIIGSDSVRTVPAKVK